MNFLSQYSSPVASLSNPLHYSLLLRISIGINSREKGQADVFSLSTRHFIVTHLFPVHNFFFLNSSIHLHTRGCRMENCSLLLSWCLSRLDDNPTGTLTSSAHSTSCLSVCGVQTPLFHSSFHAHSQEAKMGIHGRGKKKKDADEKKTHSFHHTRREGKSQKEAGSREVFYGPNETTREYGCTFCFKHHSLSAEHR